tara:strand:+ start:522 stop:638 length:117 start_codon:yes stop_codon:yes gene_type:complete
MDFSLAGMDPYIKGLVQKIENLSEVFRAYGDGAEALDF